MRSVITDFKVNGKIDKASKSLLHVDNGWVLLDGRLFSSQMVVLKFLKFNCGMLIMIDWWNLSNSYLLGLLSDLLAAVK